MGEFAGSPIVAGRLYTDFGFCFRFSSAYFQAQIEQPVRGLMSLFNQKDVAVLVAINERGIFIIDQINSVSCDDEDSRSNTLDISNDDI